MITMNPNELQAKSYRFDVIKHSKYRNSFDNEPKSV